MLFEDFTALERNTDRNLKISISLFGIEFL